MKNKYLTKEGIERKYENRDKLAKGICGVSSVSGYGLPLLKTILTSGEAYSPEAILGIGTGITALSVVAYKLFDKWNQNQKQKALSNLEVSVQ